MYLVLCVFSVSEEFGIDSMLKVDPRKSTRSLVDRAELSLLLEWGQWSHQCLSGSLGDALRGFGCGAPSLLSWVLQSSLWSDLREAWSQVASETGLQPSVVGSVSEWVDRGEPCWENHWSTSMLFSQVSKLLGVPTANRKAICWLIDLTLWAGRSWKN